MTQPYTWAMLGDASPEWSTRGVAIASADPAGTELENRAEELRRRPILAVLDTSGVRTGVAHLLGTGSGLRH
jgi:hypothetical protein